MTDHHFEKRRQLASAYDELRATMRRVEKRLPDADVARYYDEVDTALAEINVRALTELIEKRADEAEWRR